jgi:hypothetical protein
MPNGKPGDHPITDIRSWKRRRFSEEIDRLITEIVQLGGRNELELTFNLFSPPPISEFRRSLAEIRDRLANEARERGWEV